MTSPRDPRSGRQAMVSPRGRQPASSGRNPVASGGFRLSPGVVFLAIALVLSVVYLVYALTVRDTSQIPLLASGAVVLGIAFAALALYCLSAVWRAGVDGRGGTAILLGLVGGVAAVIAAGCVAGAIVLFMLAGSS
jgi:hypothetical protein